MSETTKQKGTMVLLAALSALCEVSLIVLIYAGAKTMFFNHQFTLFNTNLNRELVVVLCFFGSVACVVARMVIKDTVFPPVHWYKVLPEKI